MPEEEAPPVVAVIVASDPGPWFEECLEAIGAQDYPNLSVLVVDAASRNNPASRVAAVLPQAFMRRVEQNRGYGATANDVLGAVRGASHLLFCHDDIAPMPDAVRRMVEEAYRSNAGVVAPKLVAWDDPRRLLQVGLSADRLGAPIPRVERDEVDQSQHDEVRDVFVAPGGCTLVRADLFERLGGFDEEISLFGEDLDLCWRAQIAGARVVVAPSAVVRHLEATAAGIRRRPDKRLLQRRHEIRAVLKNYSVFRRLLATIELALLSTLEAAFCAATGDRARARQIVVAWRWNLAKARRLRAARRRVRSTRVLSDHAVGIQLLGSQRVRRFVRHHMLGARPGADGDESTAIAAARAGLALAPSWLRSGSRNRTEALSVISVLILVLAVGMRGILFAQLPLIGGLAPFPGAVSLLSTYFTGWQAGGIAGHAAAPPAFGLVGAFGLVLIGSTAMVQKLIVVAAVLVGAIGASRMVAPFGSSRGRIAAAVVYLALPLYWNDIAKADLAAMIAFAGVPFLLTRLARASRIPPFDKARAETPLGTEIVAMSLQVAVIAVFDPVMLLVVPAAALAFAAGSLVGGELHSCLRTIVVAAGGTVGAFVLTLPWSLTFFEQGARWSVLSGALGAESKALGITALLRFDFGPMGSGLLAWGMLAAAFFPLLVARGPRLSYAVRWWVVALGFFFVAWAGTKGWLGSGGAASGILLAPAAAALAATVALGIVAFEQDLPGFRFGWRQIATAAAVVCACAGMLPFFSGSLSGHYGLAGIGYDQPLSFLDATGSSAPSFQVLWLGDPASLPMRSWQLAPGEAAGVSENGLPEETTDLWPSLSPGPVVAMTADVALASDGLTVQLGRLLAPLGVRYLVVTTAAVPVLPGLQSGQPLPQPAALLSGLAVQQDLRQLPSENGALVFVNTAWNPSSAPARLSGLAHPPLGFLGSGVGAGFEIVLFAFCCAVVLRRRVRSRADRGVDPGVRGGGNGAPGGNPPTGGRRPPASASAQGGRAGDADPADRDSANGGGEPRRRRYQPPSREALIDEEAAG